jgi:plasmid stabilization system protein ParE
MAVRWRDKAINDLERIDLWLSSIEGADPDRVRARIWATLTRLDRRGDFGRPSKQKGMREVSVRGAPYVIFYRMNGADIDVHAVRHARQIR